MTDFEKVVRLFSESRVECVIVGGLAATIHGSARLTQDVDFVYARNRTNVGRLVAALKPYSPYLRGAPPGLPFDWSEATIERGLNFTLTTALGDIDLLGEITGGGASASMSFGRPAARFARISPGRSRQTHRHPNISTSTLWGTSA